MPSAHDAGRHPHTERLPRRPWTISATEKDAHVPTRTDDTTVVSNSAIKLFRRCPRATLYKHSDELAPRLYGKALTRGKWFHELMENYYRGEDDWKEVHQRWVGAYSKLFDEEKEKLGDLPTEVMGLMRSYLWHYHNDQDWEILRTEGQHEVWWTPDILYKFRYDLLVRDEFGLWIVDHKTHKRLPDHDLRLLDTQSVLYVDAINSSEEVREELGIGDELIQGFIWNYVKTEGPTKVRINQNGSIAKNQAHTDYPTAYTSIKNQGKDPKQYKDFLRKCAKDRYVPGQVQTSPFFQRVVLERDPGMIDRVRREALRTAKRYRKYRFDTRDAVERTVDRSCGWCDFRKLCITELMGGNTDFILKKEFERQDPFAYYGDNEKEF